MSKHTLDPYRFCFAANETRPLREGELRLTSFGTTTFLLDDGETQILLDALLTRPSLLRVLFSPLRTNTAFVDTVLEREGVDRLKAIFVSHSHYDHVLDAACIAQKTGAVLHGSVSTLNVGRGGDLPEGQMQLFAVETPVTVGAFTITVLPSIHSKPNFLNNDLGVVIDRPLRQPARKRQYTEGGSYDFLIRHGDKTVLVRPSYNYIPGALEGIRADTLLLGIGGMGKSGAEMMDRFYAETVQTVRPSRIVPVHWDNFFLPLTRPLQAQLRLGDNLPKGLDYLLRRTKADGIDFQMLEAFTSVIL